MTSPFEREPLKLIINLREHFASRLSILNHNAQKFEIRLIEKDVEEKTDAVEKLFPFFRPEDRMILDDFIEELYDLEDRLKTLRSNDEWNVRMDGMKALKAELENKN